jgi:hypothetical protein
MRTPLHPDTPTDESYVSVQLSKLSACALGHVPCPTENRPAPGGGGCVPEGACVGVCVWVPVRVRVCEPAAPAARPQWGLPLVLPCGPQATVGTTVLRPAAAGAAAISGRFPAKGRPGFTVLNPAYQIPDRRGRAQVSRGHTGRSRMNRLPMLRFRPLMEG